MGLKLNNLTVRFSKEMERQSIIQQLLNLGITGKDQRSIHEMNYWDLKHLLDIAKGRHVQIESDENKWF